MICTKFFAALFLTWVTRGLAGITIPTSTPPPSCVKNGVYYHPGERFQPDPCQECLCDDKGRLSCAIGDCFYVPCVDPVHIPTQCCPICPNGHNCRHSDGTIIKMGETYQPDPYTTCRCPEGMPWMPASLTICAHVTPTTSTTTTAAPRVPTLPH